MRALLALALTLAATCAPAVEPAVSGGSADPLWEKAVAWARRAAEEKVTPGRMDIHMVVRKKDGEVQATTDLSYRVVGAGEESDMELLRAVKDGKDITAEVRKAEREAEAEARKREKGGGTDSERDEEDSFSLVPAYHPFEPEVQPGVTYRREGEAVVGGKAAWVYAFRTSGPGGAEGKVWLERQTGQPLQVEVRPAKLPKHADRMTQRVFFGPGPDGLWVAERSEVEGSGGFLWIRRSVESTFRFSQYRRGTGG